MIRGAELACTPANVKNSYVSSLPVDQKCHSLGVLLFCAGCF